MSKTVESTYVGVFGITLPGKGSAMKHVDLFPGVNQVEDADWTEALKNTMVQHHLKIGTLKEHKVDTSDISKISEKEALELVELTVRPDLLETWGLQERRPPVAKAIREQMKRIDPKEHAKERRVSEGKE